MTIRVAIHHKTYYKFDRSVALSRRLWQLSGACGFPRKN